eukprot:s29_g43.t1
MPPPEGKVEELSSCLPGDKILAWYSDELVYHERILIWKTGASTWYILTPDKDLYEENYADPAEGPSRFHIKGLHFKYYSRLPHPVYRFENDPTEDELRSQVEKALDESGIDISADGAWRPQSVRVGRKEIRLTEFLPGRAIPRRATRGGGVVEHPANQLEGLFPEIDPRLAREVSVIEPAPPGKLWVTIPALGDTSPPAEIVVSPGSGVRAGEADGLVQVGSSWKHVRLMSMEDFSALFSAAGQGVRFDRLARDLNLEEERADARQAADVAASSESNPDARVLAVDYDSEGERFKEWRQVTLECKEYSFSDWPLDGPLTTLHYIKHTARYGGDPKRWLSEWMRSKQIQEGDRICFEVKVLVESIYLAVTYDQLNVSALACIEIIARRIQAIVEAYSSGPVPDWHSAKVMTLYRSPEDAISPQLRSWAARKNKEELDLAQTRAKVREGRKGLVVPEEAAAGAVADGALPNSGPKAKARPKGRGRGLEAPPPQ